MDTTKTTPQQAGQQGQAAEGARRPRRRIAKELLQRGQRLRNRLGVALGVSLGAVALLSVLE